jgi:hypothetical protein
LSLALSSLARYVASRLNSYVNTAMIQVGSLGRCHVEYCENAVEATIT